MRAICSFIILSLFTNAVYSQGAKVRVLPEKAILLRDGRETSSPGRIAVDHLYTIVMGAKKGYVTQARQTEALLRDSAGKSEITITLHRGYGLPKNVKSKKIQFSKFVDGTRKTEPEKYTGIHYKKRDLDDFMFISRFSKLMADSGYKMVGKNALFDETGDIPEYILGGEIAWIGKGTTGFGFQVSTLITWSLFNIQKQEVVYQTTTAGYSNSKMTESFPEEMGYSMEDALKSLITDPTFQDLIVIKSAAAIAPSEKLSLEKVTPQKYSSYSELVKNTLASVVTVKTKTGHSSGFVISNDGYVVSNYQVAAETEKIELVFEGGYTFSATVVRKNEKEDLALLKIAGKGFKPLAISANVDDAGVGTEVLAVGTPMETSLGQTVTKGIVSGKRILNNQTYIQTDVELSNGSNGGPLLNITTGEVIGVVSKRLVTQKVEGISFAMPISEALSKLNIVIK